VPINTIKTTHRRAPTGALKAQMKRPCPLATDHNPSMLSIRNEHLQQVVESTISQQQSLAASPANQIEGEGSQLFQPHDCNLVLQPQPLTLCVQLVEDLRAHKVVHHAAFMGLSWHLVHTLGGHRQTMTALATCRWAERAAKINILCSHIPPASLLPSLLQIKL